MWIFKCDRCYRDNIDNIREARTEGEYAGSITLNSKEPDDKGKVGPEKHDLCMECWTNLQWWLDKIDVAMPTLSTAPPDESDSTIETIVITTPG